MGVKDIDLSKTRNVPDGGGEEARCRPGVGCSQEGQERGLRKHKGRGVAAGVLGQTLTTPALAWKERGPLCHQLLQRAGVVGARSTAWEEGCDSSQR